MKKIYRPKTRLGFYQIIVQIICMLEISIKLSQLKPNTLAKLFSSRLIKYISIMYIFLEMRISCSIQTTLI